MRVFSALAVFTAAFWAVNGQYTDGTINVTSPTTPVQMRQAFSGPTGMMLSWNTFGQLSNPTVTYGTSPTNLNMIASSTVSITYNSSLTYNNHVNLTGLLPNTQYYWLPQYSNATTPYMFKTQRAIGDFTPYTVAIVVDMGTFGPLGLGTTTGTGAANPLRPGEQTTITAMTELIDEYEFVVHSGDIAYADAWIKEEVQNYLPTTQVQSYGVVYEKILDAFFDELLNITANRPYMVSVGNHEANCLNGNSKNATSKVTYTTSVCVPGQLNFTGYINHWRMPSGPSGGVGNMWYSYTHGMAHFVHISTETDLGNGLVGPDEGSPEYGGPFGSYNQQINWLINDLASVNRTLTPWIVVFGHRPFYLSGSTCAACQTAFEQIFWTYGVDLYFCGHSHVYERMVPIYNNTIDPNGLNNPNSTWYVVNGAAGHYDGLDTFGTIQPYDAYHQASEYTWSSLTFTDCQHLTLDTYYSTNNSIYDTATLFKNRTCANAVVSSSSTTTTMPSTSTTLATVTLTTTVVTTTTSTSVATATTTLTSTSVTATTTTSVSTFDSTTTSVTTVPSTTTSVTTTGTTETDTSTTSTTTTATDTSTTSTTATATSTTLTTETDTSTTLTTETDTSTTQTTETDTSTTATTTTTVSTATSLTTTDTTTTAVSTASSTTTAISTTKTTTTAVSTASTTTTAISTDSTTTTAVGTSYVTVTATETSTATATTTASATVTTTFVTSVVSTKTVKSSKSTSKKSTTTTSKSTKTKTKTKTKTGTATLR